LNLWGAESRSSRIDFTITFSPLNNVTIIETIRVRTVGDERDYNLAVLVILLLLFWPLAIVYYYTRPKKPYYYPSGQPPSPTSTAVRDVYCQNCNNKISDPNATFCPYCGQRLAS
jgi:zinc ribbon protein